MLGIGNAKMSRQPCEQEITLLWSKCYNKKMYFVFENTEKEVPTSAWESQKKLHMTWYVCFEP